MNEKQAAAALMVLTAAQVPGIFSTANPSLQTVRKCNRSTDKETVEQLRQGELEALVIALLVGAATSTVAKSPWPFLGVVAASMYYLWKYEHHLNKEA